MVIMLLQLAGCREEALALQRRQWVGYVDRTTAAGTSRRVHNNHVAVRAVHWPKSTTAQRHSTAQQRQRTAILHANPS